MQYGELDSEAEGSKLPKRPKLSNPASEKNANHKEKAGKADCCHKHRASKLGSKPFSVE
jgi:hypothetical protein